MKVCDICGQQTSQFGKLGDLVPPGVVPQSTEMCHGCAERISVTFETANRNHSEVLRAKVQAAVDAEIARIKAHTETGQPLKNKIDRGQVFQ